MARRVSPLILIESCVIPDGGGRVPDLDPQSPLRSPLSGWGGGGFEELICLEAVLVIPLVHQTAVAIVLATSG